MYKRSGWKSRLRALLLVGLLATSPAALAVTRDGGVTFSEWVQQLLSSVWTGITTMDDEECPPNTDCGSLHIPGG